MIEPKECLELANECMLMAQKVLDKDMQTTLLEMAAVWSELAKELEQNAALWKRLVGYSIYPDSWSDHVSPAVAVPAAPPSAELRPDWLSTNRRERSPGADKG